ncbi:MotA/TolQ/ExbB proton channel family protein [Calycomorphotria hydatis]|uniref:Biopolymer transport protein ExbB n=1 Tax=Calycomorphotria hydatis TaxID=2528027 RepID=A0A517T6Q5_9PLAN|nr:MotA/TolQ/ExbB proton channel family protein [Calycomorphotria hydatis]QDT64054.1 Biopolymer transport protein ExbB [Calycomorphotria hydatis]
MSLPHCYTCFRICSAILVLYALLTQSGWAQETPAEPDTPAATGLNFTQLLEAGGYVGYVILALSIAMIALLVQQIFALRKSLFMPRGLADEVYQQIQARNYEAAEVACRQKPSLLAHLLSAGLAEVSLGYSAVEKAMEDAGTEYAARLFRKIDTLSTIGTLAPMLGLMGTVWGMIQAFVEFETKANPQVAELAPGIYRALVTTLLGLGVAVPSLAGFAFLRNRIDELVAETSLLAEQVFADFKRSRALQKRKKRRERKADHSDDYEHSPEREAVGRPMPLPPPPQMEQPSAEEYDEESTSPIQPVTKSMPSVTTPREPRE